MSAAVKVGAKYFVHGHWAEDAHAEWVVNVRGSRVALSRKSEADPQAPRTWRSFGDKLHREDSSAYAELWDEKRHGPMVRRAIALRDLRVQASDVKDVPTDAIVAAVRALKTGRTQ